MAAVVISVWRGAAQLRVGKEQSPTQSAAPAASDVAPITISRLAEEPVPLTAGGAVRNSFAPRITSGHIHDDLFSQAPTGWRTAGNAIAEVTNRWQSDPRWTFFSLQNDLRQPGKTAVLWSKYLYPGDLTLEFYVCNKQAGERGQPFTYAKDINVTICSDGADLGKGYTFKWGGDNNTVSKILRDGLEVKRSSDHIPTDMNYTRYWFRYRVEKQGGHLIFHILDSSGRKHCYLTYDDPQPLKGSRVAIWTHDNAIMLARVRLSGDGGIVSEHPDWQPGPLKTPYGER